MYKTITDLLEQKLNEYEKTELEKIDRNTVEDISNIKIDTEKSSVERILDFLLSYDNPYIFKIENSLVKIPDNCITNVYKHIYK